ncbi:GGDEF domain-containing protein [Nitratifractor sp.]|uniref:GGDEF domain-containing protein n=1 Tax=Nitratifractor sp. TaxID=2268144 RepID=UPI0025FCA0D7|nr:GGDEF domain-containing protein [Nitratifractor sp.]
MKFATLSEILEQLKNENHYWQIGFYGLVAAAAIHFFFLLLFTFLDIPLLAAVNIVSVGLYLYCIFVLGVPTLQSKDDHLIGWLVYGELIGHNLLATWLLGRESGFQFYLYIPALLPFFILSYSRLIYFLRLLFVIALALWVETSPLFNHPRVPIDPLWLQRFNWMNLLIFLLILSILAYLYALKEHAYSRRLIHDLSRDPLTGLFNRRILDEILKKSQGDSARLGVLLLDVDYFKKINDTFGHEGGDYVLKQLAAKLKTLCPRATILRWGGEEFLILLADTDKETLQRRAEQIRQAVESSTLFFDGKRLDFTVTLGATLFALKSENFRDALVRADKALYEGKKSGRNRAIFYDIQSAPLKKGEERSSSS